jgi:hypothetical protein
LPKIDVSVHIAYKYDHFHQNALKSIILFTKGMVLSLKPKWVQSRWIFDVYTDFRAHFWVCCGQYSVRKVGPPALLCMSTAGGGAHPGRYIEKETEPPSVIKIENERFLNANS